MELYQDVKSVPARVVEEINQVFGDPEVTREQHRMAEIIADNMDVEELPW